MAAPSRTPLISGNWKMHHNHFEAIQTVQKLAYLLDKGDYEVVDVSVHPPFTDLRSVQTVLQADEIVSKKVQAILTWGMTPILCCGETLDEREADETEAKVSGQVRAGLAGVSPDQVAAGVIAYEPIWAIGTGRTATAEDAQAMCGAIRSAVAQRCGADAAASLRVQYGGSVKASNIAELMAQDDIDGALVGGASLDPDEFARIVQYHLNG